MIKYESNVHTTLTTTLKTNLAYSRFSVSSVPKLCILLGWAKTFQSAQLIRAHIHLVPAISVNFVTIYCIQSIVDLKLVDHNCCTWPCFFKPKTTRCLKMQNERQHQTLRMRASSAPLSWLPASVNFSSWA